jgi:membrane-associated phospholipid phosphatase
MRAVDIITFSFLSFLVILTVIYIKQIPNASIILSLYLALIGVLSALIYLRKKYNTTTIRITYDLIYPVIAILLVFDSLGGLIRYVNPATYDDLLIRIDYLMFNSYPTVALEKITTPLITEFLQLAYTSYYFLPLILCITLKITGKNKEFERALFLIILCFFLSYVGYILVPAIGPRYTMNHLHSTDLHGLYLRDSIDSILNSLEGIKRDAFPSGHTAVTLVVSYLAYRFQKPLFWASLPFVMALIVATVYLRYHYVIDVLAGILLFVFTILIGERYYTSREKWISEKNAGIS